MFLLLWCLLLLLLPLAVAFLFQALVGRRIASDGLRVGAVGLCYVAALLGYLGGTLGLLLASAFDPGDLYPVVAVPVNDAYYFTQQQYCFVTMMSSSYNLTLYRNRLFRPDQELGMVQLECSGEETIEATLKPAGSGRGRLRIAANAQARLDTLLDLNRPFNFRRTFDNHTLDFTRRR